MKVGALLLCAGKGERLGADVPKALAPLAGRPLFTWSLEALERTPSIAGIVMVGPVRSLREALAASGLGAGKIVAWTEGGKERQDSVARGLHVLPPEFTHVAVHDAARALVTVEVITRVVGDAVQHGAALAAVPLEDTLKRTTLNVVDDTVPRKGLWRAQTPQAARRDWLEQAHAAAQGIATDDVALLEAQGRAVRVTLGDPLNFKITTAQDLALAECWLAARAAQGNHMNVRVGMGYDVHKLVKGRKLILGGVEFPGPKGLEGHSDADVLSHAIGDALLGAAALGDLGTHFPPGDAKWKDASSIHLLGLIRAMLEGRGMRVVNVDSSVVCEEPKLAPLREQMTIQIARALKVSGTCVSIKATTNETLGALGRGEGIAAMAVVLLEIGIAIGPSRSSSSEALPL